MAVEILARRGRWFVLVALLSSTLGCPVGAGAQEPCDPRLVRPPGEPFGYGLRGDRCEGLYVREVAGSGGLLVASFTEPFEHFDFGPGGSPGPGGSLHLEWTAPRNAEVRLRGFSLRRKLYYRMDTIRPPGTTTYVWSADVLASLKMRSQELAIVGWTSQALGGRTQEVYVPLRVGRQGPRPRSGRYLLVLLPGADLTEVFITLSTVGADGRAGAFLKRDEPLGYGYYPAERGITVPLPELKAPGIYQLQAGATLTRGGSAARSLLFYHPGG